MRKLIPLIAICIWSNATYAQTPTMQEKLYYTCKVWGFVKYYHSEVSVCNVNWDSVLIDVLPDVRAASTNNEFNDALMHMLDAAGPMALATTPYSDTFTIAKLKQNRDWSWISSPILRIDVQILLDTIKNNFRRHPVCWVEINHTIGSNAGFLRFPYDSLCLNVNTAVTFPNIDNRLLMFFKYWNIIRYFNPYNYVSDTSWDTTLYNNVDRIAYATNAKELYLHLLKVTKYIDDAHVSGLTYSTTNSSPPGYYTPTILLRYVQGEYVIVRTLESGVQVGDAVISVDGLSMGQWEDSLKSYYSVGSLPVFRRYVCEHVLRRAVHRQSENLTLKDQEGSLYTLTVTCLDPLIENVGFFQNYIFRYPVDSLFNISWTTMPCDVGYMNLGNIESHEVDMAYNNLKNKDAVIIDFRGYPRFNLTPLYEKFLPNRIVSQKVLTPDIFYPGTFFEHYQSIGVNSNPTAYTGKIILLFDEYTQSAAEYGCMNFELMSDVIKVGSHTAGADGTVCRWQLTQDIYTGYTGVGMFYPNGDSTQRVGIVPDTIVTHTRSAIYNNRDNVLETALIIAGCDLFLNTKNVKALPPSISIYPNPANETVTISINGNKTLQNATVSITDISARVMLQSTVTQPQSTIDIHTLPPGMYFVTVRTDKDNYVTKLVKE